MKLKQGLTGKLNFVLTKNPDASASGPIRYGKGNLTLFQFHRKRDAIAHHARGAHVVPVA